MESRWHKTTPVRTSGCPQEVGLATLRLAVVTVISVINLVLYLREGLPICKASMFFFILYITWAPRAWSWRKVLSRVVGPSAVALLCCSACWLFWALHGTTTESSPMRAHSPETLRRDFLHIFIQGRGVCLSAARLRSLLVLWHPVLVEETPKGLKRDGRTVVRIGLASLPEDGPIAVLDDDAPPHSEPHLL